MLKNAKKNAFCPLDASLCEQISSASKSVVFITFSRCTLIDCLISFFTINAMTKMWSFWWRNLWSLLLPKICDMRWWAVFERIYWVFWIPLPTALTLECQIFFAVFLKHTLAKPKKNDIQKNEHFPASIKTRKKISIYLEKKKSHFWKISPTSHTLRFYLTHHNRTRFFHFLPKKLINLPFFIAISCFFSIFFRITICKPNLICQKCVINTFAKYFFHFPAKSPYIEQILGKKCILLNTLLILDKCKIFKYFWKTIMKIILTKMAVFCLILKKIHRVTPIENGWFLANFEENS